MKIWRVLFITTLLLFGPIAGNSVATHGNLPASSNQMGELLTISTENESASVSEIRRHDSSLIGPGSNVTFTLRWTAKTSTISFNESIKPSVQNITIGNVTVDGQPISPASAQTFREGLYIRLEGIEPGSNVTVRYTVQISENVSDWTTYNVSGHLTDNETISIGANRFVVFDFGQNFEPGPPITDAELSKFVIIWARGIIDDSELSLIISRWAAS